MTDSNLCWVLQHNNAMVASNTYQVNLFTAARVSQVLKLKSIRVDCYKIQAAGTIVFVQTNLSFGSNGVLVDPVDPLALPGLTPPTITQTGTIFWVTDSANQSTITFDHTYLVPSQTYQLDFTAIGPFLGTDALFTNVYINLEKIDNNAIGEVNYIK